MNRIPLLVAATLATAPLAAQTPIRPGETVRGTLENDDPRFELGAHYDAYVIRGQPGQRVMVTMRSAEFDTYLRWGSDAEGEWEDASSDDDGGGGTDSRLAVVLGEAGEFELRASGFSEDEQGGYELEVVAATIETRSIRVGDTVNDELSGGDYHQGEYGVEDHWIVLGEPGSTFTAYVVSYDFDTYLTFGGTVRGEYEEYISDDDGGGGTNSMLVGHLPDDASERRLVVRSFSGDGTGAYTLRLVPGADLAYSDTAVEVTVVPLVDTVYYDGESPVVTVDADTSIVVMVDTTASAPADWDEIPVAHVGEPIEGSLTDAGTYDEELRWYVDYAFVADEGEEVSIALSSGEFDPVVGIGLGRGDFYRPLETDDDGGPGLDALLRFIVPQEGMYVIRVTSARPGARGGYRLELRHP